LRLGLNIAANALSRVWLILLHVLLTPIVVRLLGPDSYGLVALNATVLLFLTFIDMASANILARELATDANDPASVTRKRNLLRTLEIISVSAGAATGGLIILLAPWLARHAIAGGGLPEETLITGVRLIGLGIISGWPAMFYGSGFIGLRRQDAFVLIRLSLTTLTAVGGVLLLWLWTPSVTLYLGWLAAMAAVMSIALGLGLWRRMPAGTAPHFDRDVLRSVSRFAAGSLLIGVSTGLVSQVPGFIVAKYSTLAELGAYTLAITLAQQIATVLTQPITASLMPHFANLMARKDDALLAQQYHQWAQAVAFLAMPPIMVLGLEAEPLMRLWLGRTSPLAGPTAALLPLAAAGMLFSIVVSPAFALQTAAGWTRLTLWRNITAIVVLLPVTAFLTPTWGPKAAVAYWFVLNIGTCLIFVPAMHRRLLRGQLVRWGLADVLWPICFAGLMFGTTLVWLPADMSPLMLVAACAGLFAVYAGSLIVVAPGMRVMAMTALSMLRRP
jgi:O-antigen/teichoic acid export membrane protein